MPEIAFLRLVMQANATQSRMVNKALFTMFCCIDYAAFTVSHRGAKKEFLPIDLSWFLEYILNNGSGDINLNFGTIPII